MTPLDLHNILKSKYGNNRYFILGRCFIDSVDGKFDHSIECGEWRTLDTLNNPLTTRLSRHMIYLYALDADKQIQRITGTPGNEYLKFAENILKLEKL